MKSLILSAIMSVIALLLLLSPAHAKVVEESLNVDPGGTLYVDTESGTIDVVSHNLDSVDIQVEKNGSNAKGFKIVISQDGNDVKVVGEKKGVSLFNVFSFGRSKVHFTIKVPHKYNVDLETNGGSISLSSLTGKVDAHTSGGSIKLGRIKGDVDVKTSGGSIKVEDVAGRINAHTSGGSISAKVSEQPSADSKLTTSGGSITAYLLPDIAVDLYASTSGGSVSSELKVDGATQRTKIDGKINGGGPEFHLRTSGGSVRVKELE